MPAAGVIAAVAAVASTASSVYSMTQGGSGGSQTPDTYQGIIQAQVAADQWNKYVTDIQPLEKEFISNVVRSPRIDIDLQKGKVNADVMQKAAIAPGEPEKVMRSSTFYPELASIESKAENEVSQAVRDKQIAGMQAIGDIGINRKATADLSMRELAASAEKRAIMGREAKIDAMGNVIKGIGQIAGAAGAIAKNWPGSGWNDYSPGPTDFQDIESLQSQPGIYESGLSQYAISPEPNFVGDATAAEPSYDMAYSPAGDF